MVNDIRVEFMPSQEFGLEEFGNGLAQGGIRDAIGDTRDNLMDTATQGAAAQPLDSVYGFNGGLRQTGFHDELKILLKQCVKCCHAVYSIFGNRAVCKFAPVEAGGMVV